jgi:hypothetical protein
VLYLCSFDKQGKLGIAPGPELHLHLFPGKAYSVIRYNMLYICLITGISPYPGNIPSIPDYTKYCIIIACTVTVQLPMRVLHGMCYSYTSGGDDQSPNV